MPPKSNSNKNIVKDSDPFGLLNEETTCNVNDFTQILLSFQEEFDSYDNNICSYCGSQFQRSINNMSNVCTTCGVVTDEISEEINSSDITNNKLRIVGYNNNRYQSDLYRSDNSNINVLQKKQIFNEYKQYRQKYIASGGKPIPLNACEKAAELYNKIQKQCVKRSQNKKTIMAACLWHSCLGINYAPDKKEIAKFMQLTHNGIAKGNNFIRMMVSNNQLDVDPNADTIYPEIITLFIQLGYVDEKYEQLHKIVHSIIEIANNNSIGINSLPRSKVIGTTYIVLKRCQDKSLIQIPPVDTKEFCKNKIRKNTIDRFINEINSYHSYFKDYYASVGLFDGEI
jgi:transcription initiation factor TFIIIB Brf1 subunit/transcription initiation factor TFIIB